MNVTSHRTHALAAIAAAAVALVLAVPAGAATVELSGKQTVVDENAGTYKMTGSLIGDWATTSFKPLAETPLFQAKGTERFAGCLDRGRDGSCTGDPAGTLRFTFRYTALFGSGDPAPLVWAACLHPVAGGTGAFAGAKGVLVFADTPTSSGVSTSYIGNLTLGAQASRSSRHGRAARGSVAAAPTGGCAHS
jgi:hypothetical protein